MRQVAGMAYLDPISIEQRAAEEDARKHEVTLQRANPGDG
jgi:hypothetical protein